MYAGGELLVLGWWAIKYVPSDLRAKVFQPHSQTAGVPNQDKAGDMGEIAA